MRGRHIVGSECGIYESKGFCGKSRRNSVEQDIERPGLGIFGRDEMQGPPRRKRMQKDAKTLWQTS